MKKIFASVFITLIVLANPADTKAEFFGSSYDGCNNPGDDPVGYILEKSGDSSLNRESVAAALKIVPTGAKDISFGDVIRWLHATENISQCFTNDDFAKGLGIAATETGKFAASKLLSSAVESLVGQGVLLPGKIFEWQVTALINRMEASAVRNQMILYIAAIESCIESPPHNDRETCQRLFLTEASTNTYSSSSFPAAGVYFSPSGFLVSVEAPRHRILTNVSAVNGLSKLPLPIDKYASQIPLSAVEFFTAAASVYDTLLAAQSGTFSKVEAAAVKEVVSEAKKIPATDTKVNATTNSQSLLARIWSFITSPFRFIGSKIAGLFTKREPEIPAPSELSSEKGNKDMALGENNSEEKTPVTVIQNNQTHNQNTPATQGKVTGLLVSPEGQPVDQAAFSLMDDKGNYAGSYVGGIATDVTRLTQKNGALETPVVAAGRYTLNITCGVNCLFGEQFATTLTGDIYARWSKTVGVDINKVEVNLGKIELKKWTRVNFSIATMTDPDSSYPARVQIKDSNGRKTDNFTSYTSSGSFIFYFPDGTYTLVIDESPFYKIMEKQFSVSGGTLDLGKILIEK